MADVPRGSRSGEGGNAKVTRREYTLLVSASLAALAGCQDVFDDEDDTDDNDEENGTDGRNQFVPDDIEGLLTLEDEVLTDETHDVVRESVLDIGSNLVEEGARMDVYRTLPGIVAESDDVDHVVSDLYFRDRDPEYSAVVCETAGETDTETAAELIGETLGEGESEGDPTDYEGIGVREIDDGPVTEWIATPTPTTVVAGTEEAVRDSIDVTLGEQDPFGGPLQEAYRRAPGGLLTASLLLDPGEFETVLEEVDEGLSFGAGLLPDPESITLDYRVGDEAVLGLELTMASAGEAEQMGNTIDILLGDEENGLPLDIDDNLLEYMAVSRDDEHVTIEIRAPPAELADLLG